MSEIHIDHEAALRDAHKLIECSQWMIDHGFSPWEGTSIARAYLDLHAQLAAEREMIDIYKKTVNHHSEVLSKFFQCGQKYNHFGSWGDDMVDAVPRLVEAYEAERARVVALCDVIHDANGIAYPFAEMQDKMTVIINAHAQGDEPCTPA